MPLVKKHGKLVKVPVALYAQIPCLCLAISCSHVVRRSSPLQGRSPLRSSKSQVSTSSFYSQLIIKSTLNHDRIYLIKLFYFIFGSPYLPIWEGIEHIYL